MYLIQAPKQKFGILPLGKHLLTNRVKFYNNIAICYLQYDFKLHLQFGCQDITPETMIRTRQERQFQRVCVIVSGGFGDCMWILPFAKFLKTKYPSCHISILTEQKTISIFQTIKYISSVLIDNYENRCLVFNDCDEVYNFGGIATIYTEAKKLDPVEAIFKMACFPLPSFYKDCRPDLSLTYNDYSSAETLLKSVGIHPDFDHYVVIVVESSTKNRDWPFYHINTLAKKLSKEGLKVILLSNNKTRANFYTCSCKCGFEISYQTPLKDFVYPEFCPSCNTFLSKNPAENDNNIVEFNSITSFRQAMAIVKHADCVITPNSGLMVVSTSFMVPTIALFGAFHPSSRTKFYEKFTALYAKTDCSPCNEHWTHCKEGAYAPCMKAISADDVFSAFVDITKKYPVEKLKRGENIS